MDRSQIRPLTFRESLELAGSAGSERWYEELREEAPRTLERCPVKLLPLNSLREAPRDLLPPHIARGAKIARGMPALAPCERPRSLYRFNGRRVVPCDANFTQIFNGENRMVFSDASYPWSCIGRISLPNGKWGSGALVGRSTVLTASHVLAGLWQPGGPLAAGVTFTPAQFNGNSLLGTGWSTNIINVAAWETTNECEGYDMAVCQLDRPIGARLGTFGICQYDDDWEDMHVWLHIGYPYDLGTNSLKPCFESGIAVFDDDSDSYDTLEIETKADIASGQSGGPLFARFTDGKFYVIGTLSGREDNFGEEKNSLFAGGAGLIELVRWARQNFD